MSMFFVPEGDEGPMAVCNRLIGSAPELRHLKEYEPPIAVLMREFDVVESARRILGTCSMPMVQGRHRKLFDWLLEDKLGFTPIYLITLDNNWWRDASTLQREILVFHELCHTAIAKDIFGCEKFKRDTGEPIWAIVGHDVEEFTRVVTRYGAWTSEIQEFIAAAKAGGNSTNGEEF